jgi:nucleotide-binding universal stress UspA family protein
MQRVLFATDLSARSDRAGRRALALARAFGLPLVVLHVVDAEQPPLVADHLCRVAEQAIAAELADQPAGVATEIRVERGRDFADIIRIGDEIDAALIVLGTHRGDSLADLFRGTTAERVIRDGHRPVLVVKQPCHGHYRHVLVAVDFSVYARQAVRQAVRLAPGATLHLLHVFHVPFSGFLVGRDSLDAVRRQHAERLNAEIEAELAVLAGLAPAGGPPFETIVREGDVQTAIRQEAERLAADLLVVGTHGRAGVSRALLGSVAEDMLRWPPTDVLAVRAW